MKLLLIVLALIPCLVNAQILFDPVYNLSNTPSATSDYHSVYSINQDYFAAWGDNSQILLKHSTNYGGTWGPAKVVTSDGSYPDIAARSAFNIAVAYHDLNNGVFFKRTTDGGNTWSAAYTLSLSTGGITPQIADGGGYLYTVWEERPGNIYQLFFSRSSDFGTTWSAPVNISNTPTTSRWAQIRASGNTVYCAWIETTTYPFSDIYFTKSTDAGLTWTTPANITNDDRPQNRIYMELAWNGNLYIASDDITSYPVFNKDDIYLLKSTDGGAGWSAAVNITNNPGHSNTPCLVVIDPVIYFTWSDNTESAPAYDNSDIYLKISPDGGLTWGDSVKVSSNPETSSRPRICWTFNGPLGSPWVEVSVIWYDYSTGDAEILARNGIHYIPVELTSFTAEVKDNDVMLYWSTATETNNKGFEIERKIDTAGDWQTIAFINGNGTTTAPQEYYYTDKNLSYGKYYYRLKQIDYDGSSVYSVEIEASPGLPVEFKLSQNYPNPFNPSTKISYILKERGYVKLMVYDLNGELVGVLVNETKEQGYYEEEFNAEGLSSGIYFYRIEVISSSKSVPVFTDVKKMIYLK